jgi:hypothetical protein
MSDIIFHLAPHAKTIIDKMILLGVCKNTILYSLGKMGDGALENIGTKILEKFCKTTNLKKEELNTPTILHEIASNPTLQTSLKETIDNSITQYQSAMEGVEMKDNNEVIIKQKASNLNSTQEALNNGKLGSGNIINLTQE